MYRNGHTIHSIPPVFLGTYLCIDATYKIAIHFYTVMTLASRDER